MNLKINLNAYEFEVLNCQKQLIRVGGSYSLMRIGEQGFVEQKRFDDLKHPSEIAVSFEEDMFAVRNTSGHIAIYEKESGKRMLRTKGLKTEGTGFFFDKSGKSIVVSEWGGTVVRISLKTGEQNTIMHGGKEGVTRLYNYKSKDKDEYYILHSHSDNNWAKMYELNIDNGKLEELYSENDVCVENVQVLERGIVLCVRSFVNNKIYIQMVDKRNKKQSPFLLCEEYNAIKGDWGYITHMHIKEEFNMTIISHSDGYVILDNEKGRIVHKCKVEYLSQAKFFDKDKILLGTWKNMMLHKIDTLYKN